ncbi:MAG: hypothetical protein GC185_13100 [Alphaproteobacteria bacterium]|nr:hypothetical protein [Alphaproteobacteria bacterium]
MTAEKDKIVRTAQDVKALFTPNALPHVSGLRVMVHVPALSTQGFAPDTQGQGRGVLRVEENEGVPLAIFRNPKDSVADAASCQKFPLDGTGVLIFPVPTREEGAAMLRALRDTGALDNLEAGTGTLADLDRVLKTAEDYFISRGMVADMYNTDTAYQSEKMTCVDAAQGGAAGIYAKKPLPVSLIVLKAKDPGQLIEFKSTGRYIHDAAQFGAGSVVLISEGAEIRKMAPDYAEQKYTTLDGAPVDLGKLPVFDADDLTPIPSAAPSRAVSPKRGGRAI